MPHHADGRLIITAEVKQQHGPHFGTVATRPDAPIDERLNLVSFASQSSRSIWEYRKARSGALSCRSVGYGGGLLMICIGQEDDACQQHKGEQRDQSPVPVVVIPTAAKI